MKWLCLVLLTLISTPESQALGKCVPPAKVHMPKTADLQVPGTPYSVGICYLARSAGQHRDLIMLKKAGATLIESVTTSSITSGRVAELAFEKATERYVAVSYDAGEFCNGVVIFDVKETRVAAHQSCVTPVDRCHVTALDGSTRKATLLCKDEGAEGEPPQRKEPLQKVLELK